MHALLTGHPAYVWITSSPPNITESFYKGKLGPWLPIHIPDHVRSPTWSEHHMPSLCSSPQACWPSSVPFVSQICLFLSDWVHDHLSVWRSLPQIFKSLIPLEHSNYSQILFCSRVISLERSFPSSSSPNHPTYVSPLPSILSPCESVRVRQIVL